MDRTCFAYHHEDGKTVEGTNARISLDMMKSWVWTSYFNTFGEYPSTEEIDSLMDKGVLERGNHLWFWN